MAQKTIEQHQTDIKRWGPQGRRALKVTMKRVLEEIIGYARKNKLNAAAPRGPGTPILGVVSSNLWDRIGEDSSVSIDGLRVVGRFGTNLTNRGYSYPRRHEYGLGEARERSWARSSVKAKQTRLREEVRKTWVNSYGK